MKLALNGCSYLQSTVRLSLQRDCTYNPHPCTVLTAAHNIHTRPPDAPACLPYQRTLMNSYCMFDLADLASARMDLYETDRDTLEDVLYRRLQMLWDPFTDALKVFQKHNASHPRCAHKTIVLARFAVRHATLIDMAVRHATLIAMAQPVVMLAVLFAPRPAPQLARPLRTARTFQATALATSLLSCVTSWKLTTSSLSVFSRAATFLLTTCRMVILLMLCSRLLSPSCLKQLPLTPTHLVRTLLSLTLKRQTSPMTSLVFFFSFYICFVWESYRDCFLVFFLFTFFLYLRFLTWRANHLEG